MTGARFLPDQITLAAPLVEGCPIFAYEAQQEVPFHPDPPMILQSYLDAVIQGFLVERGSKGLRCFVDETRKRRSTGTGMHRPIRRAVTLNSSKADLFDRLLLGASFVETL